MSASTFVKTTCNRDCPDACGIVAEVEGDRVVALRGDPDHPITKGFLCYRTSRFLTRQYHPSRILKPLLRVGGRQVEIPLAEALDLAAEKLAAIKKESGPGAILHYRSGGSLGVMKLMSEHFFGLFGPVAGKVGDICSGGGDAAQAMDFGEEDSNDIFDLYNAKHIINWGKNLYVSNLHLIPLLKEAKNRGIKLWCIDPVRTRSAELADQYLPIRPDGDLALGLAIARRLFEKDAVSAEARARCDYVDELRALAFSKTIAEWSAECDLPAGNIEALANAFAEGPTAILVGWGLQRTARGASNVRILDALSVLSGNLGRKGGGVSFYYKRRGAFDLSWVKNKTPPPRVFSEPLLGEQILAADPPLRAIWVTAGNPVAMLPDSAKVARAFEQLEFSVVVDSFPTDTTRRATLVLPTTTLLEDDDLLGAYGHHFIGVSRPVVPPPPGVLTDLEITQALAQRLGIEGMEGSAREWKKKMLARVADKGASIEALERGHVKNPLAKEILYAQATVPTKTGRVQLIHAMPPVPTDSDTGYPLHLLSNSTEKAQSSQWSIETEGAITATLHPDAAGGIPDGALARLSSPIGSLVVRVVLDSTQRTDVVVVPKGGHFDRGWAVNALIRARETDHGRGAAYLSARVKLEPM